MPTDLSQITSPQRFHSRDEVLSKPSPIPKANGLYGWYFNEIPGKTPTDNCITSDNKTLLYVGISPDKSSKPNSTQNLRKRITYHYRGNAEGSTLRRTLGILLTEESGYPLRRVGSGKRMTLTHDGEKWLDEWMQGNAFICWMEHDEPWTIEEDLISISHPPLNIMGNSEHPFYLTLRATRKEAIEKARELPIADDTRLLGKD
tara:strand:- start:201 stop:809 length:609 start_codon:yes stop_codon:yes gene_type:complete